MRPSVVQTVVVLTIVAAVICAWWLASVESEAAREPARHGAMLMAR